MPWTIDRIEGGVAVCEDADGARKEILITDLPEGAREGDVLTEENGVITVDEEQTLARRNRIRARFERLKRG